MLRKMRLWWLRVDKTAFAFAAYFALVVGLLVAAAGMVFAQRDAERARMRDFHASSLECLARNVYYEARGESLAGQYAVAEVTMNRKASPSYPKTVCDVVYQRNWDPLRGRYVGAFSWTELGALDAPQGEPWQRAVRVAEDVYYRRRAAEMPDALHFHAVHVRPEWSKDRERIARVGRHVFYR